MIVRQDRNPGARLKLTLGQPAADALGHASRFGVGAAFDPVTSLNFESGVVGPALSTLAKEIVEGRHGPAGKYTGKRDSVLRSEKPDDESAQIPLNSDLGGRVDRENCFSRKGATYAPRTHLIY
jgi:hypothetical protein